MRLSATVILVEGDLCTTVVPAQAGTQGPGAPSYEYHANPTTSYYENRQRGHFVS